MIEELAIAGGGVKGLALLGALSIMDLTNIKKIAGTSIGAVIGSVIAMKMDLNEVVDLILHTDLLNVISDKNYLLKKNYALTEGTQLKNFIKSIICIKEDPDISLLKMYNKYGIELIVAVTNITYETIEYISYKNEPDMSLIKLLIITTSLPGIFPPIRWKNCFYCDGALIDTFPTSVLSESAYGIRPKKLNKISKEVEPKLSFSEYIYKIINIRYENSKTNTIHIENIIEIDVGSYNVTSFGISNDEKLSLIIKGIESIKKNYIGIIL